jgi:hypothetical protein
MRIIGPSILALFLATTLLAADDTLLASIGDLATALSENDPDAALRVFDSKMKDYGAIEAKIEALAAQAEVSCAIDIVTDEESDGFHKLDLDWFMELKSQGDIPQIERRRQRVHLEMHQIKGSWKITAISPLSILDPINVR